MRAGLMWAGRDRMLGHLHAVITELAAISRYRSAPVTELADDGEQRLDLFAAQWNAHAPEALGARRRSDAAQPALGRRGSMGQDRPQR